MTDIEKARELYAGVSRYFEETGFAPVQAQVYREMLDFMSDCETVEQATAKFKDSPYYAAGTTALMRDKALARARAARELGMGDVALVYEDKEREIALDAQAAYDTAFEHKAHELRSRHANERAAAREAHLAALEHTCAPDAAAAQAQAAEAWPAIKAAEHQVKEIGARMLPTIKAAECIVLPPADATGAYEYTQFVEEVF